MYFSDLLKDGVTFTVSYDLLKEGEDLTPDAEYEENIQKFTNLQLIGEELIDEDTYTDGEPFQVIGSKMTNLIDDGKIKKRILRKGYGNKPLEGSIVRVNYNAYVEYNAEPFDSTYARKKVHQFQIGSGSVIPCLDIAVQSMMLNEKSQFLVAPEYAYGKLGCLNRVPPNSEILFEIELVEVVDVSAAMGYQALTSEEKKKFCNIYDFCLALCAKGKDLYNKNLKNAIKEYNTAVGHLENAYLDSYEDEAKQQTLLLKLYTNLLICYTKNNEPKKGCLNFNKIKELVKGTDLQISSKIYFNNAKCLRILGDYDLARKRLGMARRLEPKNPDILNELVILDQLVKEHKMKEKQMAKAVMGNLS